MVKKTSKRIRKKKKEIDHVERLEKEIRELKSINRALMKRLKKLDRDFRKIEDLEEELVSIYQNEDHAPKKNVCPECSKGKVEEVNLGARVMRKCENNCGYREFKKV